MLPTGNCKRERGCHLQRGRSGFENELDFSRGDRASIIKTVAEESL